MAAAPKCVVLSCLGGAQGELGVVRSLGRKGVHVVLVSEYEEPIARFSRYTKEFIHIEGLFDSKEGEQAQHGKQRTLQQLIDFARLQDTKPVIFPTADPDLAYLSEFKDQLEPHYHLFLSRPEIIENFMDKEKFFHYALQHDYPIPYTQAPRNLQDVVELSRTVNYPVIIKPVIPKSWGQEAIRRIVDWKKAIKVETAAELIRYYEEISVHDKEMVIQEYIPGRDDRLYSLHIYIDRRGKPLGHFVGRKMRTFPTYAGIGCHVVSVDLPEIVKAGVEILRKVDYTGLALLQFKHDPRSGDYRLLEINPRVSSWNQLATECGVNLPYAAYADAAGLDVESQLRQDSGVKYFYFEHDLHAFLDYRKHGDCTFGQWLGSYRGPKVFQFFATDDMRPYVIETRGLLGRGLRRALRSVTG